MREIPSCPCLTDPLCLPSRVETLHWRDISAQWQVAPITDKLTLDVEVLCVALAVALCVGGDAGVEPGLAPPHVLQHQGPVPYEHAARHVLPNRLALWEEKEGDKKDATMRLLLSCDFVSYRGQFVKCSDYRIQ